MFICGRFTLSTFFLNLIFLLYFQLWESESTSFKLLFLVTSLSVSLWFWGAPKKLATHSGNSTCYVLVNGARRLIRIPAPDYLIYPTDPPLPQSPPAAQSHSAGEEWLKKKNQFLLLQPLQLPLAAYHTYPYAGAQCVDAGLALVPLYLARHFLADRRAVT